MSSIEFLSVNNSCLIYNKNFCNTVKDYYDYICLLLYKFLETHSNKKILFVFENIYINKNEDRYKKYDYIIFLYINIEHTLVRIGGRDTANAPLGNISVIGVGSEKNENYLIRIDKYDILNKKDIIIDYSIPNIINISNSLFFSEFSKKIVCVSPLLYKSFFISSNNRNISCLTTFINTNEPRRHKLLENAGSNIININNCFSRIELQNLYMNTKIILNIHQTDYHHTFEELRVLPAICCGVIVICEISPLTENIPYNEFIIWSDYNNILEKMEEVKENYNKYYNDIYGNNKLKNLLDKIEKDNYNNLYNKIEELII